MLFLPSFKKARITPCFIKNIIVTGSVFFLVACSHPPQNSIALQPLPINVPDTSLQSDLIWQLTTTDKRIAHYLIAISDGDDVATLVNEKTNTLALIENRLQTAWGKQQLNINTQKKNSNNIDIQLIKLLTKVQQNTLSYELKNTIKIKINLTSTQQHFSKTFTQSFTKTGAFKVKINDLNESLNAQLSILLNSIIHDPELNLKLRLFNTNNRNIS